LGTVRGLAAVDWNRDGRTDILCATTGGLTLHLRNGNGWTRESIISNTDLSDVVAVDLDRDGRTDAVASAPGSGNLRLVHNVSKIVGTGTVALPSGGVLGLKPGQNGHAFSIPIRNPGRASTVGTTHLAEPPIVVTGSSVRFFKADPNGAGWKKGAAMTKTEVEQAVASVALVSNGQVIGSAGPNDVTAGGSLEINHNPVLGNLVPVAPDSTLDLHFRVALKSTAANTAFTTFYLAHGPVEPATARSYEGGQFGLTATGRFAEARIEILPSLTGLQEWRQMHFGNTTDSGNAANDHDHDGDGLPNLVEYALGTNPKVAESATNAARFLKMDTSNGPNSNALARVWVTDSVLADPKIRLTLQQTDLRIGEHRVGDP
ncbi:MAG: VCBS repeat-containing protein, partial [Myxococcales bacterium]